MYTGTLTSGQIQTGELPKQPPQQISELTDEDYKSPNIEAIQDQAMRLLTDQEKYSQELLKLAVIKSPIFSNAKEAMIGLMSSLQGKQGALFNILALFHANPKLDIYTLGKDEINSVDPLNFPGTTFYFDREHNTVICAHEHYPDTALFLTIGERDLSAGLIKDARSEEPDISVGLAIPKDKGQDIRITV